MPAAPSSDDYDDASFEITADILASLKDTEDRYTLSLSQVPSNARPAATSTPAARPPPAKKFKPNGWKAIAEEEEDNPDIVLLDDSGRYGVVPVANRAVGAVKQQPVAGPSRRPEPVRRAGSFSGPPHVPPARPAPAPKPPTRPPLGPRTSSSTVPQAQPSKPSPLAQSILPSPSPPVAQGSSSRLSQGRPVSPPPPPNAAISRPNGSQHSPSALEAELAALRAQFAEIKRENEALQIARRAAEEAQYTKAGEAANVRRAMERQQAQSAEALARAKAEKDELAAAKARVEKELKNEMERLKTNLTFRAHELETSSRKPAWSVRKKVTQAPASQVPQPSFPGPTPSRAASRSQGASGGTPGRTNGAHVREGDTTVRDEGGPSRSTVRAEAKGKQPEKPRPAPAFPNFHNSFAPSKHSPSKRLPQTQAPSPSKPSPPKSHFKGKGKEKENEWGWGGSSQVAEEGEMGDSGYGTGMEEGGSVGVEEGGSMEVDVRGGELEVEGDEAGEEGEMDVDEREEESHLEEVRVEKVNWREELHHLIFSHRSLLNHPTPDPPPLTLQRLLTVSLPPTSPPALQQTYTSACASILGAFGGERPRLGKEEEEGAAAEEMLGVGEGLVNLAGVFCEVGQITPLALTLDLLSHLAIQLPAFPALLLSYEPPMLLDTLCAVVRSHLSPVQLAGEEKDERAGLAEVVMDVVEGVTWGVSEEDVMKLGIIPKSHGVLATLLHTSQPPWLTERAARLLCLFSTHTALFRPLLSFPDADPAEQGTEKDKDYTRIPLIDLFCEYLVNPPASASFDQVHAISQAAIVSLSTLSIAHADGPHLLVESRALIPSLVRCLLSQSSLIWDEDEETMDSPSRHSTILQTLHLALTLLHHLNLAGRANLRLKLQHNARHYNGLAHAFILCVGRLSYADAPEWLGAEGVERVELMREQARDLIEAVVEGPEGDLIWAAYQDGGEDEMTGTPTEGEEEEDEDLGGGDFGMDVEDG